MNAYELADLIGLCGDGGYNQDAANMLRQQADRIAELEKVLEHEGISVGRDLLNGGVALSKKLPQTKPLSDEVIHELANEHLRTQNQDGHLVVLGMEDFARAIEERHGIK